MHSNDKSLVPRRHEAALVAHGFWAVSGSVGLSLLATGAATRLEASALQTALCVIAGAALAALSLHRAGAALDRIDAPTLQAAH